MTDWDGEAYQRRFDDLAATGVDVHGEADLVMSFEPATVIDGGCGTGRVAIELARRGVCVVGVDVDESMLAAARKREPRIEWRRADLCELDLDTRVDVVVLAGNVPLFVPDGSQAALVAACGRHLTAGGRLVAGFSLDSDMGGRAPSRVGLSEWDTWCADAGLELEHRWATWDRQDVARGSGDYAVSVHRRPSV